MAKEPLTKAIKTIKMMDVIEKIENELYYSPEDLAKKFRVSLSSIYKLIKGGELPHVRLGKIYRIPASSLKKYISKQSKGISKEAPSTQPKVVNLFLKELQKSKISKNISEVWLYGSYARGDFDINSDVDLLIVFKNKELKSSHILTDISEEAMKNVDYDDLLSLYELDEGEWSTMKKNKYLLAQTILNEGVCLWKNP